MHFYVMLHMEPTPKLKHAPFYPGYLYNGPPIGVSPPRYFQTSSNGYLVPHQPSRLFFHTLANSCSESEETAAAQNDIKAQFSVYSSYTKFLNE